MSGSGPVTETKAISAENTFTDYIRVPGDSKFIVNVFDTVSGNMTLTVQSRIKGQATPIDIDTLTAAGQYRIEGDGNEWRVGCKTGAYNSGTFTIVAQKV